MIADERRRLRAQPTGGHIYQIRDPENWICGRLCDGAPAASDLADPVRSISR